MGFLKKKKLSLNAGLKVDATSFAYLFVFCFILLLFPVVSFELEQFVAVYLLGGRLLITELCESAVLRNTKFFFCFHGKVIKYLFYTKLLHRLPVLLVLHK